MLCAINCLLHCKRTRQDTLRDDLQATDVSWGVQDLFLAIARSEERLSPSVAAGTEEPKSMSTCVVLVSSGCVQTWRKTAESDDETVLGGSCLRRAYSSCMTSVKIKYTRMFFFSRPTVTY